MGKTMIIGIDHVQLRAFVERIEVLDLDRRQSVEDIKEVLSEARSLGFDPKIIRKVVARRRQDPDKLTAEEETLELYLSALGDLRGTPLGNSAVNRQFGDRA